MIAGGAENRRDWIRAALDRYEGRLIQFAHSITANREAALDVVQETFLRLCVSDPARIGDHIKGWLYRVCRNLALDEIRKEGREVVSTTEGLALQEDPRMEPAGVAEANEERARLERALAQLPESQREVIRLRFQEGLSYKEIAEVTERTVSHVGVLIHQGMKTIRMRMEGGEP